MPMTESQGASDKTSHSAAGTVSVGLPVYNGSQYLEAAIRSVQGQTRPPEAFVVFDNASTDQSAQIAERLLGRGAVQVSTTNTGAAENFNRAALQSSSEFFLWLASDDYLDPDHISTCLRVLSSYPERSACLPGVRFVGRDGHHLRTVRDPILGSVDARARFRSYLRRMRWTEVYCLFRREDLLRSPMFVQEFGTDVVLMWWFLLRGPLAIADQPLLNYREYSKSVDEVSSSIDPAMKGNHWRKCRLWTALWRQTKDPGVTRSNGRIARQELLLCVFSRYGLWHLADDVMELFVDLMGRHPVTRRTWAAFFELLRVMLRRPQT